MSQRRHGLCVWNLHTYTQTTDHRPQTQRRRWAIQTRNIKINNIYHSKYSIDPKLLFKPHCRRWTPNIVLYIRLAPREASAGKTERGAQPHVPCLARELLIDRSILPWEGSANSPNHDWPPAKSCRTSNSHIARCRSHTFKPISYSRLSLPIDRSIDRSFVRSSFCEYGPTHPSACEGAREPCYWIEPAHSLRRIDQSIIDLTYLGRLAWRRSRTRICPRNPPKTRNSSYPPLNLGVHYTINILNVAGGAPPQRGGAAAPWRRSRSCICPRNPPKNTRNTPYLAFNTHATELDQNIQNTP